jgi:hypothetical protein
MTFTHLCPVVSTPVLPYSLRRSSTSDSPGTSGGGGGDGSSRTGGTTTPTIGQGRGGTPWPSFYNP